ncbi:Ribosome production factor 1 [Paramarasmius palmivorus]|uniref:Ribosome production factor 1 n=1 Tax=Paramarasmius palmivorus TaxID=297713 RepID=A0AAW0BER7_9AGAR
MPPSRFEPSVIKNKIKREEIANKNKKSKRQDKLQRRLDRAKLEATDPAEKKSMRSTLLRRPKEKHPLPGENNTPQDETAADIDNDPFAYYFTSEEDPNIPPKVLITTSPKASKATYEFCDEIVGVFPGAEFIRRKKGKGFEMGRIAGWAAGRGYKHMCVVNEDMKKPNAITLIHLPNGPTAYFKLSSVELTRQIYGHARATPHNPELVLNGFVTRLGHTVGRMFQTMFPALPEFQGRQVVTLHNQRDFLFFRRHRYAFRSTERVALQEIGPRFTLKLRSLRKGIPAVQNYGESAKPLEFDDAEEQAEEANPESDPEPTKVVPPKQDEYLWKWKPELETTRRTFFL